MKKSKDSFSIGSNSTHLNNNVEAGIDKVPASGPDTADRNSFKGQVAIVTGAASGLGLAIANKLMDEGAVVALMDINKEGLELMARNHHKTCRKFPIDITREALVVDAVESIIGEFGKIDILVNGAGISGETNVLSHNVDYGDLRRVLEVNFISSFSISKVVLPHMLKMNYGRVLHIASIAGKEGNAGMLAYSASKAAVIGMAKVQGKEYAETGITVNALAPAVIRTPLVDAMPEVQVKYMTDKIPMKRCGTLEEAANLVAYIVSKENSFVTGFTFDLSGGRATY